MFKTKIWDVQIQPKNEKKDDTQQWVHLNPQIEIMEYLYFILIHVTCYSSI